MAPGQPQSIVGSPRSLGSEISDGGKATGVSSGKDELGIETETTPFLTRILLPHCAPSHHKLTARAAPSPPRAPHSVLSPPHAL